MNDLLTWKERTSSFAAEIKHKAAILQYVPPVEISLGVSIPGRQGYMNMLKDFEQMEWLPTRAIQNLPVTPAPPVIMSEIQNKGTGAGGANTNVNGKSFEKKTDNEARLLAQGFVKKRLVGKGKYDYYLEKGNVVYLTQGGLKKYMKQVHKLEMIRCPDEAYLVKDGENYVLKILEKKNQNVEGSVADKLQIGDYMQYEYECCLGEAFASIKVDYAFCISEFLKKIYTSDTTKYKILREYNKKNKVSVLFGDDEDYFAQLDKWISV